MIQEKVDPVLVMENVIFLKRNPLFADVRTEELRAIAAISREREFKKGECVVKENDPGDSLFIVKTGSIRVTKSSGTEEVLLAVLPQESCFGEMVIFEDAPRSASGFANEDCSLLIIQRDDLLDVILEFPGIALEMFRIFGKRLREANEKIRRLSEQVEELKKK
jgi:CRP-like cAMP-binding protein